MIVVLSYHPPPPLVSLIGALCTVDSPLLSVFYLPIKNASKSFRSVKSILPPLLLPFLCLLLNSNSLLLLPPSLMFNANLHTRVCNKQHFVG